MRYLPALIVDAVFVLIFAAIGRASHEEDPSGFILTGWPFLVALVVGYVVAAVVSGQPRRPWSLLWGMIVWVATVACGMLVRVASGDTAELPFIIVATIVLGIFLLGWRTTAAVVRKRGSRSDAASEATGAPIESDAQGVPSAD